MCDRCLIDMLMYGEPVEHEPPVWEKGRFAAKPVGPSAEIGADAGKPAEKQPDADDPETGRDEE